MRAYQAMRPARPGRGRRLRLAGAVLVEASLPACTGDNLFTGLGALSGLLGPEVEITAPQANLTLAVGGSVQVTANVSAPDGVTNVSFKGVFTGRSVAFTEIPFTLPVPQDTTVTRTLVPAGASTGTVRVIVTASDALGETGADTVTVSIN
ncbi:MAG: hypothetical protein EXR91_07820 [Gemmatimonadetes bacterium]|nr:hypothetical protein [Gemmatimonadota bacterium]